MISREVKAACAVVALLSVSFGPFAPLAHAQGLTRSAKADLSEDKRWLAVAPGRVEPLSGEIKIVAPLIGVIGEVLVKANDSVFAGEPLVRITDDEARRRLQAAEVQVALRLRARDDEYPSTKAAIRRRADDAVADAEKAVAEARASLDQVAVERRAGRATDADVEAARSALTMAHDHLQEQRAELRRVATETPSPSQVEGQLNLARIELLTTAAAIEKMTIRAPIGSTILQVNAKVGELASPSLPQPLVILGDISALRVRAEVDERDLGVIKMGQSVTVRSTAFRGREFGGKVSFIAPLVESGRNKVRDQRNATDVDVVEVVVDLSEPGPLSVGMKVDVYFPQDTASSSR
jgi:HlyD family secretion protein